MTTTNIPFDAPQFLTTMYRRSFAFVGCATLLKAHLTLAPNNRLTRDDIHHIFHAKTLITTTLIDDVIGIAFRTDDNGMVYCSVIDRAVKAAAQ